MCARDALLEDTFERSYRRTLLQGNQKFTSRRVHSNGALNLSIGANVRGVELAAPGAAASLFIASHRLLRRLQVSSRALGIEIHVLRVNFRQTLTWCFRYERYRRNTAGVVLG